MATFEFRLPDIGEGVVEGEIVKWLVREGDVIEEDQALVEVMTDKATVTIPSPKKGKVVKTFGNEGDIAKVHSTLVTLEVDGAHPEPVEGVQHPGAAPSTVAEPPGKVLATPVTRRMAREHGLDLSALVGSGPQGRVTKADVEVALTRGVSPRAAVAAHGDQRIPLKGLRRKIAEKMARSKHSAAHFTFVEEMDATRLVQLRQGINDSLAAAGEQVKISFLPFICKALVASLRKFPTLNANFDEAAQELIVRSEHNLGIAVSTPEGLTVPVVRGVDRLSVRALGDEIARLGNAAREKRLTLDELTGGTFTITSLGQTAGLFATPIINHPEVAILGVHRMRKRPVVTDDDQIVIRQMMYLSLSFDHRVIDGAVGADFTYALIGYLEHPDRLMLELT